jgi:hypothetical protein
MSSSKGVAPHVGPVQFPEISGRVAKGAGEAAQRMAESAEHAAHRVAEAVEAAGSRARTVARRRAHAAAVRVQLANTSRELAHETADLGQAVESLNALVKADRKTSGVKRRRLVAGIAIGAALAYHLDTERGRQRRAATAQMLTSLARDGLSRARAAAAASGATETRSA